MFCRDSESAGFVLQEDMDFSGFSGESDVSGSEGGRCSRNHLLLHDLSGHLDCAVNEFPETMDGKLWGRLPEDLLERVLQKVPIRCLCRFRSVCARWRSVLSSEGFMRRCTRDRPCISAIEIISSSEDLLMPRVDSTSMCRVYKIDLSFIPTKIFSVATSHKGLVCFSTCPQNCNTVSLCVCNPISRVWKALPEITIPVTHTWEAAMVVDDMSTSFKVIVMSDDVHFYDGDNENVWTYLEYSSELGAWTIIQGDDSRGTFFGDPFLLCRDIMYSLDDDVVHLYNTIEGKLVKKLDVETHPGVFSHARLMEHHGDVLLVGDIQAPTSLAVAIWKLDLTRSTWDLVSMFPVVQRRDMAATDWAFENWHVQLVNGVTVSHYICLQIAIYHDNKKLGLQYVLAYNTEEDVWHLYHMKRVRDRAVASEHQEEFWQTFPLKRVRDEGLTLVEPRLDIFI